MTDTPRIAAWFDVLLDKKGSDLHLGVGYPPLGRIRGELMALREEALTTEELESLLFEICSPEQKRQITEELDLDFAYGYGTKARFRANYFYRMTGIGAVFRTIPSKVLSLEDLKTPEVVRKMADRRSGLVLVTGPTGSGKSTTLAGMINHINKTRPAHVLTVEDPVEFVHESLKSQVTHREVGPHASSFATAIRSAGREDPNVILIGELRTNETMKLALQLASFGVLVFATVHTNSAPATIDRIINSFPADEQGQVRGMLAESLAGIVAQQLIKTADGKGRVAALEILVGSAAIAAMIREGKVFQIASKMQAGQNQGMQTLDMHLERLVKDDVILPEAALEKAQDKENFVKVIQRLKPDWQVPETLKA
ncbi:PilT/PilU family type 4a pilus ATPase [Corallococcus sp. AB004]|uniref:type IV pilus twitching motility protein PilT n=1 Tax=Corallococcus exiguus TaxID=83462 RepID=UPI000EA09F3C|nr:PilT/PilU family type 4a pilus ATPase [Corallococcus exiguus]NPD28784.1 PilT/PilU family type 4a pilus ATPase [Corallococcus exiguus]NRD54698.1 PilT/PilU family type 4a pilus ATPase [Corallococcus exiguus]RKI38153.1 PilT/PilU family type 4a pilus ATPase [Corallococcus sp. AB004]